MTVCVAYISLTAGQLWQDMGLDMSVVDLFIRVGATLEQGVVIQAATGQGRHWLQQVGLCAEVCEALVLKAEDAVEAALGAIPEAFEVVVL